MYMKNSINNILKLSDFLDFLRTYIGHVTRQGVTSFDFSTCDRDFVDLALFGFVSCFGSSLGSELGTGAIFRSLAWICLTTA